MMDVSDSSLRLVIVLLGAIVVLAPVAGAGIVALCVPATARGKRLALGVLFGSGVALLAALLFIFLSYVQARFRTLCGDTCSAQSFVLIAHASVSLGLGFLLRFLWKSSRTETKQQTQTLHVGLGIGLAFLIGLSIPAILNLGQFFEYESSPSELVLKSTPSPPAPTPLVASAEWFTCVTDSDCAIGEGICGMPAAYNIGQREAFLSYASSVAFGLTCPAYAGLPRDQISAVCFAKQCVLSCSDTSICITR